MPDRIDVLQEAQKTLGPAFDRNTMRCNGRVIRVDDLMRIVNHRRVEIGVEQILYSPNWKVRT